jgi:hypothetical protein
MHRIVAPPPSQILDHIILGGLVPLTEPELLKKQYPNLNYVMCCAEECKACKQPLTCFTETRLIYPEELTENNIPNEVIFQEAFNFIELAREKEKQIYIHCARGRSRSATIVIAYLMFVNKSSLRDSYLIVKRARPFIGPHGLLRPQLLNYERLLIKRGHYGTELTDVSIRDMLDWHSLEGNFDAVDENVVRDEIEQLQTKSKLSGLLSTFSKFFIQ